MAASSVSIAASSSAQVSNPAPLNDEETDHVASGQRAELEINDSAPMVDCPEYWIG
jgi:hypothetical protein